MVMFPNILEMMLFRISTRVKLSRSPRKVDYVFVVLVLEKLKVKNVLNVYFAARFILSSNSNNCCLLYFNANIMCSVHKKA